MNCRAVISDVGATHREGQSCRCIRPEGHADVHVGERPNGTYFAWEFRYGRLSWCEIAKRDAEQLKQDPHYELVHPCDAED